MSKKLIALSIATLLSIPNTSKAIDNPSSMPPAIFGLIGVLAGGFMGGFIAKKTLSPEKLNSTDPSNKTENEFRRFFYILAGAATGGLIFTAPYLLKWSTEPKTPHIPHRQAQPIPERARHVPERQAQRIPQR